jgi:hypothetical protein
MLKGQRLSCRIIHNFLIAANTGNSNSDFLADISDDLSVNENKLARYDKD